MDHITERSRKGVEDKMGCEHKTVCVSMCVLLNVWIKSFSD